MHAQGVMKKLGKSWIALKRNEHGAGHPQRSALR
jgi:hypothetical protein